MRNFSCAFVFIFLSIFLSCVEKHEHYSADLTVEPETIESGKTAVLSFQVKNPKGEKVTDLEIVHEKPMHLFLVSEDLAQYFHEHPQKQADGSYQLPFTFPNGGKFKIFIDFKPKDDEQTVESFDIEVAGELLKKQDLVPDEKFEKSIESIFVRMKPESKLLKQQDTTFIFEVFDAETKAPVSDLQNYLGEKAHFVIIRKGLGRFVHVHPMSSEKMMDNSNTKGTKMRETMPTKNGDVSKIAAMAKFPNSGIYKIFAQFKRNDEVITVPFVFEVK